MMEGLDAQQQLQTFKQNDTYKQLLSFTEVRTSSRRPQTIVLVYLDPQSLFSDSLLRVLSVKSQIYPLNWSRSPAT